MKGYFPFTDPLSEVSPFKLPESIISRGVTISVLSEVNPLSGLSFNYLLTAGITSCIELQKHLETPEMGKFRTSVIEISESINQKLFGGMNRLPVVSSILDGAYPFVKYIEDGDICIKQISELGNGLPKLPIIPIDFAVCYSGEALPSELLYTKRLNDLQVDYSKQCRDMPWYDNDMAKYNSHSGIDCIASMVNANVLKLMHDVYFNLGGSVIQLLDYMSRARLLQFAINNGNQRYINLMAGISLEYTNRSEKITIIPHDDAIRGGSFTIASQSDRLRRQLGKTFRKLYRSNPSSSILYTSWDDKFENRGLAIEQNTSCGNYSALLGDMKFRYWSTHGMDKMGSYDHLLDNILEHTPPSLLLDAEEKKLYVGGKKIAPGKVTSQSFTVEMLISILESTNRRIALSQLSRNTYTKDIRALRGKIIYPLQKQLELKLGIGMNLKVVRGDGEIFVELLVSDGEIGIIKRVG